MRKSDLILAIVGLSVLTVVAPARAGDRMTPEQSAQLEVQARTTVDALDALDRWYQLATAAPEPVQIATANRFAAILAVLVGDEAKAQRILKKAPDDIQGDLARKLMQRDPGDRQRLQELDAIALDVTTRMTLDQWWRGLPVCRDDQTDPLLCGGNH